jgi:hypothetical protein
VTAALRGVRLVGVGIATGTAEVLDAVDVCEGMVGSGGSESSNTASRDN